MAPLLIPLLTAAAPELVKYFTGSEKAARVTEQVADIARVVAGSPETAKAVEVIQANPEKLLEFRNAVMQREADLEKAYLDDLDSARKMQMAALGQDDVFSKRFVYYFSGGWSLFSMAFFMAVTFGNIPKENVRVVDTILGFLLGTAIAAIFNFFLGSTYRNQRKDDAIERLAGSKQ